jgi:hypothetical protein
MKKTKQDIREDAQKRAISHEQLRDEFDWKCGFNIGFDVGWKENEKKRKRGRGETAR